MLYKVVPSTTSLFVFAQFQELSHFVFHFRCQLLEWRSSCIRVEGKLPHLIISHYSWHGCIRHDWFTCLCSFPLLLNAENRELQYDAWYASWAQTWRAICYASPSDVSLHRCFFFGRGGCLRMACCHVSTVSNTFSFVLFYLHTHTHDFYSMTKEFSALVLSTLKTLMG